MKRLIFTSLMFASVASAELPPLGIEHETAGCKVTWIGGTQTYFLQYSLDLQSWAFFPEIESGAGNYEYNFTCSADKMFLRLKYIDFEVSDPENYDFDGDGDGIGSLDELNAIPQTDPLELDTDKNGVSDGGLVDDDGDGIPSAYEIANGLDPLVANGSSDLVAYLNSLTVTSSSLEVFTRLK